MFFQVLKFDHFGTFGITAFNIEFIVEPEKGLTENCCDFRVATFNRAFRGRIFAYPIGDASFTEHFTARMALPRLANNFTTN